MRNTISPIVAMVLCLILSGCGKKYQLAEVSGVLYIDDKPAKQVEIQLMPDIDEKVEGPIARAITDDQGRFKFEVMETGAKDAVPGATVGKNRVVLSDLIMSASATGFDVKKRFGVEYTSVTTTPKKIDIAPGKQEIEIRIP